MDNISLREWYTGQLISNARLAEIFTIKGEFKGREMVDYAYSLAGYMIEKVENEVNE